MKKILLFAAVAILVSACGGGGDNGQGTVAGVPAGAVPAGQGDAFVSAVLDVTNIANADMLDTDSAVSTYNSYTETTPDTTIPDTLV